MGIIFNKKPEWFSHNIMKPWLFSQRSPASYFSGQRDVPLRLATFCAPRHTHPRDAVHTGNAVEYTRGTHM